MKKMMCITGLILLVCLLISGCADQQAQKQTPGDVSQDDKETIMTPGPTGQQDESPMDSVISNVSAITQEELDQLKADIEKLESEDLGGLSND